MFIERADGGKDCGHGGGAEGEGAAVSYCPSVGDAVEEARRV